MFWTPHIIIGIIVSLLLYPTYGIKVLIIFISNILIDADHYLWYVWRIKEINLFRAFKFYKNKKLRYKYGRVLHIFHTVEILLILIILSFYFEIFFLVLIGVIIHLILDIIHEFRLYMDNADVRIWSFLEFLIIKTKRFL